MTVISFPPPTKLLNMNDTRNPFQKARLVKEWRTSAYWAACQLGPPSKRRHPASVVTITLPVKGKRTRDPANWVATAKPIIDGLTDAGVWPDDNQEWVTLMEPILSTSNKEVVVTIEPRTHSPVYA